MSRHRSNDDGEDRGRNPIEVGRNSIEIQSSFHRSSQVVLPHPPAAAAVSGEWILAFARKKESHVAARIAGLNISRLDTEKPTCKQTIVYMMILSEM